MTAFECFVVAALFDVAGEIHAQRRPLKPGVVTISFGPLFVCFFVAGLAKLVLP